jgi:hypothetical protein
MLQLPPRQHTAARGDQKVAIVQISACSIASLDGINPEIETQIGGLCQMMRSILRCSTALLLLSAPIAASAQKPRPVDAAIGACAVQRAPFVQLQQRYKKEISERTTRGVLTGLAAGLLGGALASKTSTSGPSTAGLVIGGLVGAAAGGYIEYLAAKRQITEDNRELARLIDADARGYSSRIQVLADSIKSTGKCRQDQIVTWQQRLDATRAEFARREAGRAATLAAAADDKARRALMKTTGAEAKADGKIMAQMDVERGLIEASINDDKKVQDDVLRFFDNDINAMAQAQAEVEGTSQASLRGPAEAYVVAVEPPAILAQASAIGGSTASAFGSATSAFGGSAAPPAPSPPVAALPPPPAPEPVATPVAAKAGVANKPSPSKTPPSKAAPNKPVLAAVPAPPPPQPWEATITRPNIKPANSHQAVLIAQRDATAESQAAMLSGLARLKIAYGATSTK